MNPRTACTLLLAACTTTLPGPIFGDTDLSTNETDGAVVVQPGDSDTDEPVEQGSVRLTVEIEDAFDDYPEGDHDPRLRGTVAIVGDSLDSLTLTFTSDLDGALTPPELQPDGSFAWPTAELSAGVHRLTLQARHPGTNTRASAETDLGICQWPAFEDFTNDPTGGDWQVFGDAYWDPQGWLEITGNAQSRAGSIYKTSSRVNQGDFRLEFSIATGGGINSGADGFSVNVVDVPDLPSLAAYIQAAGNGGCLGYGVSPGCGASTINAFHVEMDTWYNGEFSDPTQENHIAINLDGNPSGHQLWAEVPSLENLVWRHVVVQAQGSRVTLDMDGTRLMDAPLPGFTFDGGYIGVSGSTGWASNFHRFDNLQIYDRCLVPL
jgi:hypothetical protein